MQSGRLEHRVNIAAPIRSTGPDGHPSITFGAGVDISARVIGQKGEESFVAARTDSRRTVKVLLRYREDIQTDWRLMWLLDGGDQAFDVIDVDRSKRRAGELWLMCVARKVS